jgi:hypothetical protein
MPAANRSFGIARLGCFPAESFIGASSHELSDGPAAHGVTPATHSTERAPSFLRRAVAATRCLGYGASEIPPSRAYSSGHVFGPHVSRSRLHIRCRRDAEQAAALHTGRRSCLAPDAGRYWNRLAAGAALVVSAPNGRVPDCGTLILAVWFPLLVNGLAFAGVLLTRDTADRAPSTCHWVSSKGLFIGAPR